MLGGSITGHDYVGGVVGLTSVTVRNCYTTGTVHGTGGLVGGVVGIVSGGTVLNCYATGNVSGDEDYVGGVVGNNVHSNFDLYPYSVSNCYATGNVSGANYVGGVVGNNANGGIVSNCYATGNVSGTGDYVGGVVGYNNIECTVTACFALIGSSATAVGFNNDGTVDNNVGLISEADMKNILTFFTFGRWDIFGEESIWKIDDGMTYPYLAWQPCVSSEGLSGIDDSYTYRGTAWQPAPVVTYNGNTLTYNTDYTVTYGNNTTVAQGGIVTIVGKGKYSGAVKVEFAITKATSASYTVPSGLTAEEGKILAQVALPGGWEWKHYTALVGTEGEQSHLAIFTPEDIANYNTAEVSLTVTVTKPSGGGGELGNDPA
jgi:hypothetical protein